MGYFRKNPNKWQRVDSGGRRVSRDIKERTGGNSRGQLSREPLVIEFVHRRTSYDV